MTYTPFVQAVLDHIALIPKGKVTTYREIGIALGTGAFRAIGMACGKNQNAPTIPCHRVVASNGSLGGYTHPLGLSRKISLLEKEGVFVKEGKIVDFDEKLFRFS